MKKKVFIYAALIAIIDQLVKWLVVSNISLNRSIEVIKNTFYISYVHNEGAAWNVFSGNRWFLIIISILAIYAIIKYFLLDVKITRIELVGYALLLGGVVGNLIDRLFRGYVVDYLDTFLFGYNYPVFNIADTCIVVGFLIAIYQLIKGTKVSKK
jgi:signal peptidase II